MSTRFSFRKAALPHLPATASASSEPPALSSGRSAAPIDLLLPVAVGGVLLYGVCYMPQWLSPDKPKPPAAGEGTAFASGGRSGRGAFRPESEENEAGQEGSQEIQAAQGTRGTRGTLPLETMQNAMQDMPRTETNAASAMPLATAAGGAHADRRADAPLASRLSPLAPVLARRVRTLPLSQVLGDRQGQSAASAAVRAPAITAVSPASAPGADGLVPAFPAFPLRELTSLLSRPVATTTPDNGQSAENGAASQATSPLALASLTRGMPVSGSAVTYTYQGGGTTTTPTSGNFSGTNFTSSLGATAGTAPVSTNTDTLVFGGGSSYTATDDFTAPVNLQTLTLGSTGSAVVTLAAGGGSASNTLAFSNTTSDAINLNNATAAAIALKLALSGPTTVSGSGSATLGGIVSGGGSLIKAGTGTLTLTGANTFTGGLSVQSGTLVTSGTQSAGSGAVSVVGIRAADNTTTNSAATTLTATAASLVNVTALSLQGGTGASEYYSSVGGAGGAAVVNVSGTGNLSALTSLTLQGGSGGLGEEFGPNSAVGGAGGAVTLSLSTSTNLSALKTLTLQGGNGGEVTCPHFMYQSLCKSRFVAV